MPENRKSLFMQTLIYGTGRILSRAVAFILLPILTSYLLPEEFGQWQLLLLYASAIMAISQLGLNNSLFRFFILSDKDLKPTVLFTTFLLTSIWSVMIIGICSVLSSYISSILFGIPDYKDLVMGATLLGVFDGWFITYSLIYRIKEHPMQFTFYTILHALLNVALVFFFVVHADYGVNGVLYAFIITNMLVLVPVFFDFTRKMDHRFLLPLAQGMARYGAPFVPVLLATMIFTLADRWIIRVLLDMDAVGVYSAGYRLASGVLLVVTAFRFAWNPRMFILYKEGTLAEKLPGIYKKLGTTLVFVSMILFFFGRELFTIFIDPKYHDGLWVASIVGAAYFFDGLALLAEIGIYTEKKTHILPIVTIFGALFNIVLNFWLVPEMGINGAALATLATYIILLWIYMQIGQKLFKVNIPYHILIILMVIMGVTFSISFYYPSLYIRIIGFFVFSLVLFLMFGGVREFKKLLYIIRR